MDPEKRKEERRKQSTTGENLAMPIKLGSKRLAEQRHKKYRGLAEQNREKGKLKEAERCYNKALYISMNIMRSDNLLIAVDLESLGTLLWEQGKKEAAEAIMARARRIKEGI